MSSIHIPYHPYQSSCSPVAIGSISVAVLIVSVDGITIVLIVSVDGMIITGTSGASGEETEIQHLIKDPAYDVIDTHSMSPLSIIMLPC